MDVADLFGIFLVLLPLMNAALSDSLCLGEFIAELIFQFIICIYSSFWVGIR